MVKKDFVLFPKCSQKSSSTGLLKLGLAWLTHYQTTQFYTGPN